MFLQWGIRAGVERERNVGFNLTQKGLIMVIVPLLFQVAFAGALIFLLRQAESSAFQESHAKNAIAQAERIRDCIYDAADALIDYMSSKRQESLESYERFVQAVPDEIRSLRRLVIDSPKQQASYARVEAAGNRLLEFLETARIAAEDSSSGLFFLKARSLRRELRTLSGELKTELSRFEELERGLESTGSRSSRHFRDLLHNFIIAAIALNILLACLLSVFFSKDIVRRIKIVAENSKLLAAECPLQEELKGNDEISELDNVFHRMAKVLSETREKERALARLKQEFLAMIAHDLRTPLTSVQFSVELVKMGAFGEVCQEISDELSISERNVAQMIRLINDLLDLEKLEAGKFTLSLDEQNIDTVVSSAVNMSRAFAKKNQIEIETETEAAVLNLDKDRLTQVLVNLISNAVKFSPHGSKVSIGGRKEGAYYRLEVTDSGAGVPEELHDKIFDRFEQTKVGKTSKHKGSGLGLAICRSIVEAHGGRIGVLNRTEGGSSFWFTISLECR